MKTPASGNLQHASFLIAMVAVWLLNAEKRKHQGHSHVHMCNITGRLWSHRRERGLERCGAGVAGAGNSWGGGTIKL